LRTSLSMAIRVSDGGLKRPGLISGPPCAAKIRSFSSESARRYVSVLWMLACPSHSATLRIPATKHGASFEAMSNVRAIQLKPGQRARTFCVRPAPHKTPKLADFLSVLALLSLNPATHLSKRRRRRIPGGGSHAMSAIPRTADSALAATKLRNLSALLKASFSGQKMVCCVTLVIVPEWLHQIRSRKGFAIFCLIAT
jgi:hypothetical protein